jgi:hypothetical protein
MAEIARKPGLVGRVWLSFQDFFHTEVAGGIVRILCDPAIRVQANPSP